MITLLEKHKKAEEIISNLRAENALTPTIAYQVFENIKPICSLLAKEIPKYNFKGIDEEVHYVKNYWLSLKSELCFYEYLVNNPEILDQQFNSKRGTKLIKEVKAYFALHKKQYKYMMVNAYHHDDVIFRVHKDSKLVMAKINCYMKLLKEVSIQNNEHNNYNGDQLSKYQFKLRTKKTNLAFLVYLINGLNYFEGQNASIIKLSELFGSLINQKFNSTKQLNSKAGQETLIGFKNEVNAVLDDMIDKKNS